MIRTRKITKWRLGDDQAQLRLSGRADCVASAVADPARAVALIIKIGSPGPVFYRGVRIGLRGAPFRIYKFRTMVINAEKLGGSATAEDDPRITPIGKFLRRHKLDEFPQFLNVLVGDMSLVGPRPEVQKYVDMYSRRRARDSGTSAGDHRLGIDLEFE